MLTESVKAPQLMEKLIDSDFEQIFEGLTKLKILLEV